jgi:hypothetical protein
MKRMLSVLIPVLLLALLAFVMGRLTVHRGVPLDEVARQLRAAGDSAVTEYRSSSGMRAFVDSLLGDTVAYYQAEVRAAAKLVIRHDTLRVTDTVPLPAVPLGHDTVVVALPPVDSVGIHVTEALTVSPPPRFLLRDLRVELDPDTMLVALLRTPSGVDRFVAAGRRAGVRVQDAAQLATGANEPLRVGIRAATLAACVLVGYSVAEQAWLPATISGTVCAVGATQLTWDWMGFLK